MYSSSNAMAFALHSIAMINKPSNVYCGKVEVLGILGDLSVVKEPIHAQSCEELCGEGYS